MKNLPLREAMARMSISITEDGFEINSPAGTALYDHHGSRTTVIGIPEYFPLQLSGSGLVSSKTAVPHGGSYTMNMGVAKTKPSQTLSIKVEVDTSELEKKLDEINNLIKNSTAFELIEGQVFIKPATISRNEITIDKFSIHTGVDSIISEIIKNAIANQKDTEQIEKRIQNATREAIEKALRPSGAIYRAIKG